MRGPDESGLAPSVLASAEEAFARVMGGVVEQTQRLPPDLEPADALRWAGDRVTELLADLGDLPLDRLRWQGRGPGGPVAAAPPSRNTAAADHDATAPAPRGDPLVAHATRGGHAETRLWVHVIGEAPGTTLTLALGELIGPDGSSWSSARVSFVPAEVTLAGPVISAVLRLHVPSTAIPGDHHGLVVGRGVPGAVVPITLVVR